MSTEIKTWEILNDELIPIKTTLADNGRKETEHLEKWIKTKPDILGNDILSNNNDKINLEIMYIIIKSVTVYYLYSLC